jgi:hypothetical protein
VYKTYITKSRSGHYTVTLRSKLGHKHIIHKLSGLVAAQYAAAEKIKELELKGTDR